LAHSLSGSVAVVTGGARGIGRACALRLASLGASVLVADRDLNSAAEFGEKLSAPSVADELRAFGGRGDAVRADLSAAGESERVTSFAVEQWGHLDILVTVAGGAVTPFERSAASVVTDADLSTLVDANLRTTISACRAAVPHMRESGGGSIVTMGSVSGLKVVTSGGELAAYGMIKAALHHYTRYLATDVGRWNIRANCVAPGAIATARVIAESARTGAITDRSSRLVPLGRQGDPSDVADAVEYLTSPLAAYVSGQVLAVNGGSPRL
jgi:3-oxoacyl-[acyl-carrier protein] reductase